MDKMKPLIAFKDDKELQEYLKWWQEKLHLNHWVIRASLVDRNYPRLNSPTQDPEEQYKLGVCYNDHKNHCALILICKHEQQDKDAISHLCDEKVLVHELLHVKYMQIENDNHTLESVYYNESEHGNLDAMAQTLIEVKYDLPFSFWYLPNE